MKIGGTITLSPESYLTATPIATATPAAESKTEVKIDNNTHFVFTDVTPGNYYLDVALNLNPCFLGAPGEVFNGAASYFFDNWGALGLSFKDGSSLVTGDTNVFNVYAGKTVNIKLDLPQCYNP